MGRIKLMHDMFVMGSIKVPLNILLCLALSRSLPNLTPLDSSQETFELLWLHCLVSHHIFLGEMEYDTYIIVLPILFSTFSSIII